MIVPRQNMKTVVRDWPVTDDEYRLLDKQFWRLLHKQAWVLQRQNHRNNMTDDHDDLVQDFRIAMVKAAAYYKRQTYIDACFKALEGRVPGGLVGRLEARLGDLWFNRRLYGPGRPRFGPRHEWMLDRLVSSCVPSKGRPDRNAPLEMSTSFKVYCKQITWNAQRAKGKDITRNKFWRTGMVSLSEHGHMS